MEVNMNIYFQHNTHILIKCKSKINEINRKINNLINNDFLNKVKHNRGRHILQQACVAGSPKNNTAQ